METNITISGRLTIEVDCPVCGITEEISYDVMQSDRLSEYDIEVDIWQSTIKDELLRRGWKEIDGELVCPDCVDED